MHASSEATLSMAVTATAQSAFTSDLSWDEAIVPTLRKRLENESRAISKRMSSHSIVTGDDSSLAHPRRTAGRPTMPNGNTNSRSNFSNSSNAIERPSAIPRPSLNYTRPFIDSSNLPNGASGSRVNNSKPDSRKPQTPPSYAYGQSQQAHMFAFDSDLASAANGPNTHHSNSNHPSTRTTNALPTPASSRSNSPVMTSTPYKNKVANDSWDDDGRTTPTYNRHLQTQAGNHAPTWEEDDIDDYYGSYSSIDVDTQHTMQNGIIHEAPPFTANSSYVSEEPTEIRPSLEERPFEHWYRGDLSRNGGVGELRVGNRLEMLEIASYGHKLRSITNRSMTRQRRRAESIGHRESVRNSEARDSFVFDENSPAIHSPMVLDEAPLTDMEVDTETDREQIFYSNGPSPYRSSLEQPKRIDHTATQSGSSQTTVTKIPTTPKRRQPSQIPRATPQAPKTTQRTASAPLTTLSSSKSSNPSSAQLRSRSPATPGKITQFQSHSIATPAQKRGRQTAKPSASPAVKKTKAPPAKQQRSKSLAGLRTQPREVGEYPDMPDGIESMADAIPSWTEPKKAGNWDDVVLPVVARKMGLEDHYEEADGSPRQRRESQEVIPPQPGTFGIDESKSRIRIHPETGEAIPMDDLGGKPSEEFVDTKKAKRLSKPKRVPPIDTSTAAQKKTNKSLSPPPSPAPFSQYAQANLLEGAPQELGHSPVEEEGNASCCRCIIM